MAINKHALRAKHTALLTSKEIAFLCFLLLAVFAYRPGHAHAATIEVAAGSSSSTPSDSVCQLEEALNNIQDGARTYDDCVEVGSYGSNDTINLPIGTITGPGSFISSVSKSLKIVGQGRDQSILDGAGIYLGSGSGPSYEVQDLTMIDYGLYVSEANLTVTNANMDGAGIETLDSNLTVNNVTMTGAKIATFEGNLTVNNVEIDLLDGGNHGAILAFDTNVTIQDSYFHSMTKTGSGFGLVNIVATSNRSLTIDRSTFSDANKGLFMRSMTGSGLGMDGDLNATIRNSTFTNMTGEGDLLDGSGLMNAATGISALAMGGDNDATLNYTTINNTFGNISSTTNGRAAAIGELSAYMTGSPSVNVHHTAQNDLYAVGDGGNSVNYQRVSAEALLGSGSGGEGTYTASSNGGNVSSDDSFSSYLTNPADLHNQTNLASFLGVLADNGGSTPTLALNEGSPAIDAGTNVSGMTTDQRGEARPQGNGFDAGAYESAFAVSNTTLTYPDPVKGTTVSLILPGDVTNATVGAVDYTTLPKDGDNKYPAGLTTFTFTTAPGATKTVTLYYDLPGNPGDYTARKYNTTTKLYSDIPGAAITREDYNGKSMLKLTYQITDGGILDQDGTVNGTIIDPVGLATTTLADTGLNVKMLSAVTAGLLALGAGVMMTLSRLNRRLRPSRRP